MSRYSPVIVTGGKGTPIAGEGLIVVKPGGGAMGRAVLWAHGASGTYIDGLKPQLSQRLMILALAAAGFVVGVGDFGGTTTYGNDISDAACVTIAAHLQSVHGAKAGKYSVVGASMGGLVTRNHAKKHLASIDCIVGLIPGLDMYDLWNRDALGSKALINAAYGVTYDEATMGPTYNPLTYAATGLAGVPIQDWYAGSDTVCLPAIEAAFALAHGNTETHNLGPYDHGDQGLAQLDIPALVAFIQAHSTP